ncbi:MAG: DUF805 domain-containing protein [Lachnospiraceae bacterium]|nr:DUF805 domain-containing protein [Lachnospiraceae bacterium]
MQKKKSFWVIYREFWTRVFDYKGTSSLRDYWLPIGLHAVLLLFVLHRYLVFREKGGSLLLFWIVLGFLFLTLPPFVSLTVRRLRDTGLSGIWALLLLFAGAGTCVVLALCAAGSGFIPGSNLAPALYGPPPWESSMAHEESLTKEIEKMTTDALKESTDPLRSETAADSTPETPSETEELTSESSETTEAAEESTGQTAESKTTEAESLTLSPEQDTDFMPSENIALPLYGPPPTEPTQNK